MSKDSMPREIDCIEELEKRIAFLETLVAHFIEMHRSVSRLSRTNNIEKYHTAWDFINQNSNKIKNIH